MQHVRDLIESALDEDLSLERLAAEAGVGTHAFSAAFVKAHGLPPHRYVVERRVERAKRLLRESDLPVAARSRSRPGSPARATWPRSSSGRSG